jgi:hypothetical protein
MDFGPIRIQPTVEKLARSLFGDVPAVAIGIEEGAMRDMDFKNVVQTFPAAAACSPAG